MTSLEFILVALAVIGCFLIGDLAGFHDGKISATRRSKIELDTEDAKEFQEILDRNLINYQKTWHLSKDKTEEKTRVVYKIMGHE